MIKQSKIDPSPNLGSKVFSSSFWQLFGGATQTLIRISASVFLARKLTPYDFGIFGMAILVKDLLAHIGAFGMASGLIAQKKSTEDDLCTCFWSMSLFRCLMFAGCFFGAPMAAYLWGDSTLEKVVKVISFSFIISIFEIIPYTILTKELNFKAINLIRNIGCLFESSIAVYLVYTTNLSYWALIVAMFVNLIICNILLMLTTSWWPKFRFSRASFNNLLPYGVNSLGFSLTNYLSQNLDYLLVGRLLGAEKLGLYEFAYRIPHLIYERLSRPIGQVAFPALSKIQGDKQDLINGFITAVKYVSLICIPCLTGLASLANLLVPVLWGDQWLTIIVPLQILCLCSVLRIISQPIGSVFYCLQQPRIPFIASLVGLSITVLLVSVLGLYFGLLGVAIGMVSSTASSTFLVWLAFKKTKQPLLLLYKELYPIIMSSLFSGWTAFALKICCQFFVLYPIWSLIISIIGGVISYVASLILFFPQYSQQILHYSEQILPFKIPTIIKSIINIRTTSFRQGKR